MPKLIKVIQQLTGDQIIKIGASGGSGYFYCGTAGLFMARLSEYEKAYRADAESKLKKAQDTFSALLTKDTSTKEFFAVELKAKIPDLSYERYTAYLRDYFRKVMNAKNRVETRKQYLENFVNLRDRPAVAEPCDPGVEPIGALRIMVDGTEAGRYWTTDEAVGGAPFALGEFQEPGEATQEQ